MLRADVGLAVMLRAGVGLAAVAGTLVRLWRARVRQMFLFNTARAVVLDHACVPMLSV
jgi:hypothetical protein